MAKNKHINEYLLKHLIFLIFLFNLHSSLCIVYYFVQSVTNEEVTQEELGGAKTHTSISGKT